MNEFPRFWGTQFAHVHYHPCNRDQAYFNRPGLEANVNPNSKIEVLGTVSVQVTVFLLFFGSQIFQGFQEDVYDPSIHPTSI